MAPASNITWWLGHRQSTFALHVGAIVRLTQGSDVSRFGIGAGGRVDSDAADLAAVLVKFLHPLRDCRAANESLDGNRRTGDRPGIAVLLMVSGVNCLIVGDQPEAPHPEPVSAGFMPEVSDSEKSVVA